MGLLSTIGKGLAKTLLDVDMGPLRIADDTAGHCPANNGHECDWCGGETGSASVSTSDHKLFCCRKCANEYIASRS